MVALDSTIVNVALHPISESLHAGSGIEWVMVAYLLAVCASQPATGWLAGRFGCKRLLLTSLAVFVAASLLCALATSLPMLVGFRVLQGLGGGAILPTGMAIVLELFPRERHGRAMAAWASASMVAPTVGPTVGGWLIDSTSWQWLFLVNLPIGIAVLALGIRVVPDVGHRNRHSFDLLGLLLGSLGLSTAVLGVSEGARWGWTSAGTLGCIGLGLLMLVAFVAHERRIDEPMVRLELLTMPLFRRSTITTMAVNGSQYARLVFIPLALESLRGYSALKVGTLLAIPSLFAALGFNIGGRLVDRGGPRRPIMFGTTVMAVTFVVLSRFTLTTPDWLLVATLSVQGIAWGIAAAPSMVAGVRTMPRHLLAHATAMRSLGAQVSGAVSLAVMSAIVASRYSTVSTPIQRQAAYGWAFAAAAVLVLLGLASGSRLPDRMEAMETDDEEVAPLLDAH